MKTKITLLLLPFSIKLIAGGFQIPQQSIRSCAFGGAYAAICGDPSAAYYNPGGMNNLLGQNFTAGILGLYPSVSVITPANVLVNQTSNSYTPFDFYYVGEICSKWRIGLSVNNQFGSAASYPSIWEGMYIVQNISLKTYCFQPTVSYQVCKLLSVGAGFVYTRGTFTDTKAVPVSSINENNGEATLSGAGNAYGYNIGAFSKIYSHGSDSTGWKEGVQLGVSYRSELPVSISDGNVNFSQIPSSLNTEFPSSENFFTHINMPAVFTAGITLKLSKGQHWDFMVTYDFNYTFWNTFDSLHISFTSPNTPAQGIIYNWKNATAYRFGAEATYMKKYSLRVGYYIDGSPMPDGYVSPEIVDKSTTGFTVGAGYAINKNFSVDIAYLYSFFTRNNSSWTAQGFNNVSYRRLINIYGIGINYSFKNKHK